MAGVPVRTDRGALVRIFFLTFAVYAYFMPRWADWNADSRLDLVHAIVDRHSLQIDRYHFNTWDKAFITDRASGVTHYYTDKAPGTAALGVVAYAGYVLARGAPVVGTGMRALTRNSAWLTPIRIGRQDTQSRPAAKGTNLGGCQRAGSGNIQYIPWGNRLVPPMRDWALSKYVVTVFAVGLVSALFSAFFFWFLGLFTRNGWSRWLLTGLYALCTIALPYSTNFYSHQIAAACLFVAFALLYLQKIGRGRRWYSPLSGLLLGFAVFTEYTVVVIALAVGAYGLFVHRAKLRSFLAFCSAGAIPMMGLLAYNRACFGGWLDTGYAHDFCWSSAQAAGIAGFTYPHLDVLFDLTVGSYRGLFYMSPFLLLALPGVLLARRRNAAMESLVCTGIAAAFIVVLSAYWGWNGGKVEGPRYLVPVVPFLAFPCVFALDRLQRVPSGWLLVMPTILWSVFATWSMFLGGELFPVSWYRDPIFQYSLNHLSHDEIAPNAGAFFGLAGWRSILPLILLIALIAATPGKRGAVSFAGILDRRRRSPA
ncbi:MAG: hypothetical protein NVS4B2_06760 [Chloroflexota bacterium]